MRCALVLVAVVLVVSTKGARVLGDKGDMFTSVKRALASTDFDVLDLLFKYGDEDESGSLEYSEVMELFCGRIFSVNINDILASIMKQDKDRNNSIDRDEWRSIAFTKEELKTFDRSPYITILA
uniref:EF-hand domain-containing protein n=1 Tax=Magallana gigas TaxID=29159 RepID=A0A8W8ISA4_MAGGI|nr:uncharacterized protein LOC105345172 [Crassostrea gigas]